MPGTSVNMSGPAPAQGDKTFGADPGSTFTPPNPELLNSRTFHRTDQESVQTLAETEILLQILNL